MMEWIILFIVVLMYFYPAMDAFEKGAKHRDAIFCLNLFLGWTIIGWIVALVWSKAEKRTRL